MSSAPAVLNYAPPASRSGYVRTMLIVLTLIAAAGVGAAIGRLLQPAVYFSVGYIGVQTSVQVPVSSVQQVHVIAIYQSAPAPAAKALANSSTPLTAAEIHNDMTVWAIPESRMVAVGFKHSNSQTAAAAVAAALMNTHVATNSRAVILTMPTAPTTPQRNMLYPLAGAAGCLLAAGLYLALRHVRS